VDGHTVVRRYGCHILLPGLFRSSSLAGSLLLVGGERFLRGVSGGGVGVVIG
jgi:hypothetical protein